MAINGTDIEFPNLASLLPRVIRQSSSLARSELVYYTVKLVIIDKSDEDRVLTMTKEKIE